jgi:hypothetical protein
MENFKPDDRQRKFINTALASHHDAQAGDRYAPDRLVERWSGEVGIGAPEQAAPLNHVGTQFSKSA